MAVAFSAGSGTNNNHGAAATSGSLTTYTAASGLSLMIAILTTGTTITFTGGQGITWNGTSMTQLTTYNPASGSQISVYYLLSPASGNNTLAATWTSSRQWCLGVACFTGATAPLIGGVVKATGNSTAPATGTISGGANDGYLGMDANAAGLTSNPSTSIYLNNTNAPAGASYSLGGTTASFTFVSSTGVWAAMGLDIPASTGAAAGWGHRFSQNFPGGR